MQKIVRLDCAKARAFTLSEMAIVLGIMGFVFGSIWVAVGSYSEANRLSKTVQQISAVVQNLRDHYKNYGGIPAACNDTTDITTTLYDLHAGIFTPDMVSGTKINSALSGGSTAHTFRVLGSATACNGTMASRFRIVLTNLPRASCVKILYQGVSYKDQSFGVSRVCASSSTGCTGTTSWSPISCTDGICTAASSDYSTLVKIQDLCSSASSNQAGWEFKLRL
ncbi:MAG: type II secretion system protein [Bdellovibrionales bacterium]